MNKNKLVNVLIAGSNGMVGKAILERFRSNNDRYQIYNPGREEVDYLNLKQTYEFLKNNKINEVIFAAAKVGGIEANRTQKFDFLYENSQMINNIFYSCRELKILKITFLGSSCIYPKFATQPIKEDQLLTGALEPTNDAYALAKISGVKYCEILNNEGFDCRALMPTNIFGEFDNFSLNNSHVVPALIRKFHTAINNDESSVEIWGSGNVMREIMYVKDLADAIFFIHDLEKKIFQEKCGAHGLLNIGSGHEISIKDLAFKISKIFHFEGDLIFNTNYPDGTPRKRLDISILTDLGWGNITDLDLSLRKASDWFNDNIITARL